MYIGQNIISKEEKDIEGFTKVSFESIEKDGEKTEVAPMIVSDLVLDELKTQEPMDLNFIRKVRCEPAVKEILAVLLKYNIQLDDEVNVVMKQTIDSLNNSRENATNKLFDKQSYELTMLDTDSRYYISGKTQFHQIMVITF
jgi:hypothetical protein